MRRYYPKITRNVSDAAEDQRMHEAYATIERWALNFNTGDAEAVARLYAADAVLWGTLAQELTTSPETITAYFRDAARLALSVELKTYIARALSPATAIVAGHYDLFRTLGGERRRFPARYSMTFVLQDCAWLIAEHHSSLKPEAGATFDPTAR
jgi:uncharacterized protein (TIGR02246 family)